MNRRRHDAKLKLFIVCKTSTYFTVIFNLKYKNLEFRSAIRFAVETPICLVVVLLVE